ncbi:MAG: hypothetical protein ABEJ76_06690 [Halanaeroarchaeum sp.]
MSNSTDVTIQAHPGNSQVTDRVKDLIYSRLEELGVEDARENVLLHHYHDGDFVGLRNLGVSDVEAFNNAYTELVREYWKNRDVSDDTLWVSRVWIRKQLE